MPSEDKSIISNRKLAAILFADIVGYTSLMQEGEGNAMSILDRFEEITKQKVGKFNGEIIKSYGDGSLILFDSTIDAAKCAVEMQMEFRTDPEVPLRIGIHIGEIVRKGSDVFGNGVNIASRIESMGVKGAVLLSKNARDKIKNQEILETLSLGTFDFKNVEEPIEVFALTNDGLSVPNKKQIKGKFKSHQKSPRKIIGVIATFVLIAISLIFYNSIIQNQNSETDQDIKPPPKSIAVLPLKNLSGDQNLEYVCDGMTDAIIMRLNQINDINRVSSFTSVLKYKVKNLSTPEIANELGVANILQGSFQKSGNQIKISLQLLDGISDKQIWSHLYSGEWAPNDIFGIQAEVTKNVAEKIDSEITELERVKIQKIPTDNKDAYNLFLQAEHERYKSNQSAFTNAISLYEKSIELDSNFSEAYIGIGKIWSTSGLVWGIYKEEEAWSKAKFYLTKALQLDSTNLDLQNELFGSMFYYDWNFDFCEPHFKSLTLEEDLPFNDRSAVDYANKTLRFGDALKLSERLIDKRPTYGLSYFSKAEALFYLGRKNEALQILSESNPFFIDNQFYLRETTRYYYYMGEYNIFRSHLDILMQNFTDRAPIHLWFNAINHDLLGEPEIAKDFVNKIKEKYEENDSGSPAWFLAMYYFSIQNIDTAFDWLEKSFIRHEVEMTWIQTEPLLQPYNQDERYKAIHAQMNFPQILKD